VPPTRKDPVPLTPRGLGASLRTGPHELTAAPCTRADDLGTAVPLAGPARRIVSLVPSLTEALAVTVPDRLAGATDWCTHPPSLDVPRVRGTKNPDRAAIEALAPDLVVANREENRRLDVERLRAAGVPVWVTVIESVDEALASMRRLFAEALDVAEPGWLAEAARTWAEPAPVGGPRVAVPVWRDPWMVVGPRTFTGDVLVRLGLVNVFAGAPDRYPKVAVAEIAAARPDVVVLPDEPYAFTADDGPEAFPGVRTVLVSGRDLTWYGPSLGPARARLLAAITVP
jgi:ABC-type Fe3+-hydroxamate transport system substrate-binding protein